MITLPRWRQRCASAPRATCTGTRLRSARSGWPEQVDNNILFIKIIITVLMIGVSIIITATVLTVIIIRSSCGWCELPLWHVCCSRDDEEDEGWPPGRRAQPLPHDAAGDDVHPDYDEDADQRNDQNLWRLPTCARTQANKGSSISLNFLLPSNPGYPPGENDQHGFKLSFWDKLFCMSFFS